MGEFAGLCFLVNRVLAELVSNVHAFLVILPNHTAPDLLQFDFHYDSKAEFHLCQILSTVTYHSGPVRDYLQFWLNYQIEHHLFPDLPMTPMRAAPKVRAGVRSMAFPTTRSLCGRGCQGWRVYLWAKSPWSLWVTKSGCCRWSGRAPGSV